MKDIKLTDNKKAAVLRFKEVLTIKYTNTVISIATLLSFPLVGNLSEKRRILGKSDADLREESLRPE